MRVRRLISLLPAVAILTLLVSVHATSADMTLMSRLRTAKPGTAAPVRGTDIEIVIDAHNPDNHFPVQRTILTE